MSFKRDTTAPVITVAASSTLACNPTAADIAAAFGAASVSDNCSVGLVATGTVGAACLGEGGTSTGAFHESLNQAAVERLPLVVVVTNNQYAYSTPTSRQFACRNLVDRAIGYGIEGHEVDGTDLVSCLEGMERAVTRARAGNGPQLVITECLRLAGHGEHDDSHYIDPKLKQSPLGRDCLKVATEYIVEQDWADAAILESWRAESVLKVEAAVAQVQREPAPDPYSEDWCALASKHLQEGT